MYRVTAIISDGEIKIRTTEYTVKSDSELKYIVTGPKGADLVWRAEIDLIQSDGPEDGTFISPYSVWTFHPENAKELLLIRVKNEIQKRIDYVNSIKHLV